MSILNYVCKLKVSQQAVERAIIGVSLRVKIRNEGIRQRNKVLDQKISKLKWLWIMSAEEPTAVEVNEFLSGDCA